MSTAQLAAVSYLARYARRTHTLYAYQLGQWFAWCQANGLDPLVGIQRAHVELYIRQLGYRGMMDSSVVTTMHAVRGYFRFAHRCLIPSDPAVMHGYRSHREPRTQRLDRLERRPCGRRTRRPLIRFLQFAQTLTVHHGALAYLPGIMPRAPPKPAPFGSHYAETLRGHRVRHLVGKGTMPATMPLTVPVLRV